MGKTYRSKKALQYHGRRCHPRVHRAETSGRKFIMTRKKGGGTKRLYLTPQGNIPTGQRK